MTQDVQPLTWQKRTNLEEHQQFFSKINEIIDNLAPTVDEAEAAIAQATAAVASANDAVVTANAASAAASAAATQAQTAASTVAGYDNRLTTDEGNIAANAADITALQGRMAAAESKNTQQDTAISSLQTADTQNVKISSINQYAVGLTGNQDFAGIKNNLTVGVGSVPVGGNAERWVRVAYSNENEIAFTGVVLPDKHAGTSRSMEFYCICYTSGIVFKYRQIFSSPPVASNFVITYDGTTYALWYHYSVAGTNERCAFHFFGSNFRNFVFDGVTTAESLDPADFTLFVNPTAVS